VETAQSVREALSKLHAKDYAVVITDLNMPGDCGLKILTEISNSSRDTAVIIITGYARTETAITAVNEGASGYLTKPVKRDKLLNVIEKALCRQKLEEENKRLFEEVKNLSITDGLTGLYNNRYFSETLKNELARATRYRCPLSLLMIDIDDFKKLNDRYGHLAGNDTLKGLAGLFKQSCRAVDFPARWGGEEFAIIMPETSKENALIFASRLKNTIAMTPLKSHEPDRTVQVTVSIGLANYPLDGVDRDELLRVADQALYKAKRNGKNRVGIPGGNGH